MGETRETHAENTKDGSIDFEQQPAFFPRVVRCVPKVSDPGNCLVPCVAINSRSGDSP